MMYVNTKSQKKEEEKKYNTVHSQMTNGFFVFWNARCTVKHQLILLYFWMVSVFFFRVLFSLSLRLFFAYIRKFLNHYHQTNFNLFRLNVSCWISAFRIFFKAIYLSFFVSLLLTWVCARIYFNLNSIVPNLRCHVSIIVESFSGPFIYKFGLFLSF